MDNSAILQQAFTNFILQIGNKQVLIPYHINIPPNEHPARQGKSAPEVILNQLEEDAKEQKIDLETATADEVRQFMIKNDLGLDCSGFAYRLLDELVKAKTGKSFTDHGLSHVGRTNVARLTSEEFSHPVKLSETRAGDIIKLNSGSEILHCMVVLNRNNNEILYAHSSRETKPTGVHQAAATLDLVNDNITFQEQLGDITYKPHQGDGIFRLNSLS